MRQTMYITPVGYKRLNAKFETLKTQYKECLEEMKEVKDNCLSTDNSSELNHYRMELSTLEDKMTECNNMITNTTIVDMDNICTKTVKFGCFVKVLDLDTDEEKTYQLVSSFESDPKLGMISINSPIGKELNGCVVGDIIDIEVMGKTKEYEIMAITKGTEEYVS